ncbi:MAG: DUF4347 domain-containing protein, partial [Synechococcaceae cyanobacterium]|nr:DUF4347 domain-containing protein [Synechococcaceae cyanobacterium]
MTEITPAFPHNVGFPLGGGAQPSPFDRELAVFTLQDGALGQLASALEAQAVPVLRLDPRRDGLDTLLQRLAAGGVRFDRIRLFSHGGDDRFRIGRQTISSTTLGRYRDRLESLGRFLSEEGDLLLYGCDLAASSRGQRLIEQLAKVTGADVAASDDLTGAGIQGADWDLEVHSGAINAAPDPLTGLGWSGSLADTGTYELTSRDGTIRLSGDVVGRWTRSLQLASQYQAGDRITLTFTDPAGRSHAVTHTVLAGASDSASLSRALAATVRGTAGVGSGPGAFVVVNGDTDVDHAFLRLAGSFRAGDTIALGVNGTALNPFTVAAGATDPDQVRDGLLQHLASLGGPWRLVAQGDDTIELISRDAATDLAVTSNLAESALAVRHVQRLASPSNPGFASLQAGERLAVTLAPGARETLGSDTLVNSGWLREGASNDTSSPITLRYGLDAVSFDATARNSSLTVDGIDLDGGSEGTPGAYAITLRSLTDLSLDANTSSTSLTVAGTVRSFGGDITIGAAGSLDLALSEAPQVDVLRLRGSFGEGDTLTLTVNDSSARTLRFEVSEALAGNNAAIRDALVAAINAGSGSGDPGAIVAAASLGEAGLTLTGRTAGKAFVSTVAATPDVGRSGPAPIAVVSTTTAINTVLLDARSGDHSSSGDITISNSTRGNDVPLVVWAALSKTSLSIGGGNADDQVFGRDITIDTKAEIEKWTTNNSAVGTGSDDTLSGVFSLFSTVAGPDALGEMLQSLTGFPATVKVGISTADLILSRARLRASGNLEITNDASIALDANNHFYNSNGLLAGITGGKFNVAISASIGLGTASVVIGDGSQLQADGNITITNSSDNELSAISKSLLNFGSGRTLTNNLLAKVNRGGDANARSRPDGNKSALALSGSGGVTNATISLAADAAIEAGGHVTLSSTAKPDLSSTASSSIFLDGLFSGQVAANFDLSDSRINLDGTIRSRRTAEAEAVLERSIDDLVRALDGNSTGLVSASSRYSVSGSPGSRAVSNAAGAVVSGPVPLAYRDILRGADGQHYVYLGSGGNLDLAALDPAQSPQFARLAAPLFGRNPSINAGDTVRFNGLTGGFDLRIEEVGQERFVYDNTGALIASSAAGSRFTLANGTVVRDSDGTHYRFLGTNQSLSADGLTPGRESTGLWQWLNTVENGDPLLVSAVLANTPQRTVLRLEGVASMGDTIQLAISLPGSSATPFQLSTTLTADPNDSAGLRRDLQRLIDAIHTTTGLGTGSGAFLQASALRDGAVGIALTGLSPSQPFTVSASGAADLGLRVSTTQPAVDWYPENSMAPVLAGSRSLAIDATPATGSNHWLYTAGSFAFDGSSSADVNLGSNEILIGDSQVPIAPGTQLTYLVLNDGLRNDAAPIGGLGAGNVYFAIPRGPGRIALAANPDDVITQTAVNLTSLGVGSLHAFRFDRGLVDTITLLPTELAPSASRPSEVATAQVVGLSLGGRWEVGDTLTLTLLNSLSSSSTRTISTTATSTDLATVRSGLLAAINASSAVTGNLAFLQPASLNAAGDQILLTAKVAGRAFTAALQAANGSGNSDTSQTATTTLVTENRSRENEVGLALAIQDGSAVAPNSLVSLQRGLLATEKALIGSEFALTEAADGGSLLLAADQRGVGVTLSLSGRWNVGDTIRLSLRQDRPNAPDRTLAYTVTSPTIRDIRDGLRDLINATVGIGSGSDAFAIAGAVTGRDQELLIRASASGHTLRLSSATALDGSDGADTSQAISSRTSTSLRKGMLVYSDAYGYVRYIGTNPLELDAESLLASLSSELGGNDTIQSSNWLRDSGPNFYLINPTGKPGDYRLAGASDGTQINLSGARFLTPVAVSATVGRPRLTFNPLTAVNAANRTITLPGLNASTGSIITYVADPDYAEVRLQTQLAQQTTAGIVNGTNLWRTINLSTDSVRDGQVIQAVFSSRLPNPLTGLSGIPASPVGGLSNGDTVYLVVENQGRDARLFSDARATVPILLNAPASATNPTLALQLPTIRSATAVGGLESGRDYYLIALGNDVYQLADSLVSLAKALPIHLDPARITANTRLIETQASGRIGLELLPVTTIAAPGGGGSPQLRTEIGDDYRTDDRLVLIVRRLSQPSVQFRTSLTISDGGAAAVATAVAAALNGQRLDASTRLSVTASDSVLTLGSDGDLEWILYGLRLPNQGVTINSDITAVNEAYALGEIGGPPTLRVYAENKGAALNSTLDGSVSSSIGGKLGLPFGAGFESFMKRAGFKPGTTGVSVVPSIGLTVATHNGGVTLGQQARIDSEGEVTIASGIDQDLWNYTDAYTERSSGKFALSAAVGANVIRNDALNAIQGTIDAGESDVRIESEITAPDRLLNTERWKKTFSTANINEAFNTVVSSIGNPIDLLLREGLNVYSTARNLSAPESSRSSGEAEANAVGQATPDGAAATPGDGAASLDDQDFTPRGWARYREDLMDSGEGVNPDDPGQTETTQPPDEGGSEESKKEGSGADLALALSLNVSELTSLARNTIAGTIEANDLDLTAKTSLDNVVGAGNIWLDIGLDAISQSFIPGYAGGNEKTFTKTGLQENGWASTIGNFISLGNIGKNGVGAAITVLLPTTEASNTIQSGARLLLSGSLTATARQDGLTLSIVVGTGESEQFGLSGGIQVLAGGGSRTTNTVEAGASLRARDVQLAANDDVAYVDVNGSLQYSNKIALGFSLTINKLQRQILNEVAVGAGSSLQLSGDDGLKSTADLSGTIVTAAIAGAVQKNSKLTDSNQNTSANTEPQQEVGGLLKKLPAIAGAGSVVVNAITDAVASTLTGQANAPLAVSSTPATPTTGQKDQLRLEGPFRRGDRITGTVTSNDTSPQSFSFTYDTVARALPFTNTGSGTTQRSRLQPGGGHHSGDTLSLRFLLSDGSQLSQSFTVANPEPAAVAAGLVAMLNGADGVGSGSGAFLRASLSAGGDAVVLERLSDSSRGFLVTDFSSSGLDPLTVRQGLIDAINATEGLGSGSNPLLVASADPSDGSAILLTARNAIRGFRTAARLVRQDDSRMRVSLPALSLDARHGGTVVNVGGAAAIALSDFGKSEDLQVDSDSSQLARGSLALAGAASVNALERQVRSRASNIDFGDQATRLALSATSDDSTTVATAVSLSAGVSKSISLGIAGSVAVNTAQGAGLATRADLRNVAAGNLSQLDLQAVDRADLAAAAGAVGLAVALNSASGATQANSKTTLAGTLGLSVAINDLQTVDTAATVGNAVLITGAPPAALPSSQDALSLQARTEGLELVAVSIAGTGSAATTQAPEGNALNLSGAAAGAANRLSSRVSADLNTTTIAPRWQQAATSLSQSASGEENLQAVAGGVDVAVAIAKDRGTSANVSVGVSAAVNRLGDTDQPARVSASIDGLSQLSLADLTLSATDRSRVGAYAIAGAFGLSYANTSLGQGGTLGALGVTGVGSGASNTVVRPVQARIGDPSLSQPQGGRVLVARDTLLAAERASWIRADAAGLAIQLALRGGTVGDNTLSNSLAVGIAGAVAINSLSGGVDASIGHLNSFASGRDLSLSARVSRDGESASLSAFAGGFSVAVSRDANADALGLGFTLARNTIDDPLTGLLTGLGSSNGEGGTSLKLRSLTVQANQERRVETQGVGFALSVAAGQQTDGMGSGSLGIGATETRATVSGGVKAQVDLGSLGLVITDEGTSSNPALQVAANDASSIASFGLAAAVSAAAQSGGPFQEDSTAFFTLGLSGGGVGVVNTISGGTSANVNAASVSVNGGSAATAPRRDARIQAGRSREVKAEVGAGSLAVAAGRGGKGVAGSVSLGAAVATNTIDAEVSDPTEAAIAATLSADAVTVNGELAVQASNSARIDARVVSLSVAVTADRGDEQKANPLSFSASGGGSSAINTVGTQLRAAVSGSSDQATLRAGRLTIRAIDTATIQAVGLGAAVAAVIAPNSKMSGAAAIGVSLSRNSLQRVTHAQLQRWSQATIAGDVTISASSAASIGSYSNAAAISVAAGKRFALGVAGGGADSRNSIRGGTSAVVENANLTTTAGGLQLRATETSTITAEVLALAAAIASNDGNGAGVAVGIGASVANNSISGAGDGEASPVEASVLRSTLQLAGAASVVASSSGSILAVVPAVATAITFNRSGSGSGVSLAAAAGGASATNRIHSSTTAQVDGTPAVGLPGTASSAASPAADPSLRAAGLTLSASDSSRIRAVSVGAAVAASFTETRGLSAAAAIGIALADNTIDTQVLARLQRLSALDLGSADLSLNASRSSAIHADAVAAAIALALGDGAAIGLAGGGAHAFNTILGGTEALVERVVQSPGASGAIQITASDSATIRAGVGAGALAVGLSSGNGVGLAAAIGVALARNTIGGAGNRATIRARLLASTIRTGGAVSVSAANTTSVSATVVAVSAAVAVVDGKGAGIGLAGAGSETTNRLWLDVEARVDGLTSTGLAVAGVGLQAGSLAITANDTSSINSDAVGASVAAAFVNGAGAGIAAAVGGTLSRNAIDRNLTAVLAHLPAVRVSGSLQVSTAATSTIAATSSAAAIGVAVAEKGLALGIAGAGAVSVNTINGDNSARIRATSLGEATAPLGTSSQVKVNASDTNSISAGVGAGSLAIAGASSGAAVAAALGFAVARNIIGGRQANLDELDSFS